VKQAYRVLAYLIAAEVMIQAMVMAYAIAGLGLWVDEGGVFDKSVLESGGSIFEPFPEVAGVIIHGINGIGVIPLLALLLLISSFFAKIPAGVKWAAIVLAFVVVQVALGLLGHSVSIAGGLHGLNALALFAAALYAARRVRTVAEASAAEPDKVKASV
jgi:hypothetical protein